MPRVIEPWERKPRPPLRIFGEAVTFRTLHPFSRSGGARTEGRDYVTLDGLVTITLPLIRFGRTDAVPDMEVVL